MMGQMQALQVSPQHRETTKEFVCLNQKSMYKEKPLSDESGILNQEPNTLLWFEAWLYAIYVV